MCVELNVESLKGRSTFGIHFHIITYFNGVDSNLLVCHELVSKQTIYYVPNDICEK